MEEKQRPMPRVLFSRALPSSMIICNVTIPSIIKSFHVGSVFELDGKFGVEFDQHLNLDFYQNFI